MEVVDFKSLRHFSVGFDRFNIYLERPEDRKHCSFSCTKTPWVHLEALLSSNDSTSRFGMELVHP
jgi:hypothetical protein